MTLFPNEGVFWELGVTRQHMGSERTQCNPEQGVWERRILVWVTFFRLTPPSLPHPHCCPRKVDPRPWTESTSRVSIQQDCIAPSFLTTQGLSITASPWAAGADVRPTPFLFPSFFVSPLDTLYHCFISLPSLPPLLP